MKAFKIISFLATACITLASFALLSPLANLASAKLNISSNPPIHNNQTIICGKIAVTWNESPSCPTGQTNTASYSTNFPISSVDNGTHTVQYIAMGFFCPEGNTSGGCIENGKNTSPVTGTVSPSQPLSMSVSDSASSNGFASACGTYQQDYVIVSVDGDASCHWGNVNNPGGAGLCSTGVACQVPQSHNECQNNACVSVAGAGTDQCRLGTNDCQPQPQPAHLTVVKVVNNTHGGTKQPGDFTLRVNGTRVINSIPVTENPGDYTVSEDSMNGYHQVTITGDCDTSGHVHLNTGDNKTCIIENEDNNIGTCQMPSCTSNISGCSFPNPDTASCSCGPLVCVTQTPSQNNVTVNVNQQQQQQQEVLAATVAPAVTTKQLPSTGAGAEVLLSLAGLLPLGWKLRKFV